MLCRQAGSSRVRRRQRSLWASACLGNLPRHPKRHLLGAALLGGVVSEPHLQRVVHIDAPAGKCWQGCRATRGS
jgi:hypothetical protein